MARAISYPQPSFTVIAPSIRSCRYPFDCCRTEVPTLYELSGGHLASCFLVEEEASVGPTPAVS